MWSYGKRHVIMVWLSILGGVCNRISARERRNMSRTTDRAGRNKGQWIVIGFMAFAIIVISICTVIFRSYVRGFHKVTDREIYDRYYVMITEDRKSDFWQSVYRGAFERGQEENVYVDLLGEHLSQEYTRAELMRIAMSSGVDGIFVESDESDEMSQMIDEAVERGIPVVTLYGDNTHSARCSFVGVGSYNLGREYGRQVLKLASVSESTAPMTVAVLVNAHALNSAQNIVCSGIQDALEQEKIWGPEIELSLITVDDTNTFSVEESIRDIFMNEKLPDIIICLNELSTTCVYQAVVDYNCVGEVAILGYYDTDTILKAIERNVVNATISIDTEQMGAFCVDALQEYYRFGYTSQYFTADVTIIDQNNVGEYLQAQEATE